MASKRRRIVDDSISGKEKSPTKTKRAKNGAGRLKVDDEAQKGSLVEAKEHEKASHHYTVSIALPGSIIDNAQSQELKAYLAGQIARAAAVFSVNEVIVFDEYGTTTPGDTLPSVSGTAGDPNTFLCHILQYLETPQYLRRSLFQKHPNLRFAGLLNPLDTPHHMRMDDPAEYREGVVLDKPVKSHKKTGSYVNCGLQKEVCVDRVLKPGVRVTVKMSEQPNPSKKHTRGVVVPPTMPSSEGGVYWGYKVRMAHSLGAAFTESPYEGGYDLTVGTSERGENVDNLRSFSAFRHLLIVFGGLKGLEASLDNDQSLQMDDVSLLFDHYLNTCPGQGSGTIRTEEAILVTLSALRPLIQASTKSSH